MVDNLRELYKELLKSLDTTDTAPTIRMAYGHYLSKNIPENEWDDQDKEIVNETSLLKLIK